MSARRLQLIIQVLVFLVVFTSVPVESAKRISLNKQLMKQLNQVMEAASSIHLAMYKEELEKLGPAVQTAMNELSIAKRLSTTAKEHRRQHLLKMIEASLVPLSMVQATNGRERRKWLRQSLEQFTHLARTYRVDKKYKIFFCSQDKLSWIQKGWGKRHPLNPKKKCGRAVL